MPLYEYHCRDCDSRFEKLMFTREAPVVCGKCGSDKVSQLLSTFAVAGRADKAPDQGPCGSCGAARRGMCGMMD